MTTDGDIVRKPADTQLLRTAALAALRQAAWEATQWTSPDGVREFVDKVMREVESDEP